MNTKEKIGYNLMMIPVIAFSLFNIIMLIWSITMLPLCGLMLFSYIRTGSKISESCGKSLEILGGTIEHKNIIIPIFLFIFIVGLIIYYIGNKSRGVISKKIEEKSDIDNITNKNGFPIPIIIGIIILLTIFISRVFGN